MIFISFQELERMKAEVEEEKDRMEILANELKAEYERLKVWALHAHFLECVLYLCNFTVYHFVVSDQFLFREVIFLLNTSACTVEHVHMTNILN